MTAPSLTKQRLATYFVQRLKWEPDLEVLKVDRVPGGFSRETWFVDVETRGEIRPLVVRRDPGGGLLRSLLNDGLRREFSVYRGLATDELPVPDAIAFEPDGAWLGHPFLLMTRLPGVADPRRIVSAPASVRRRFANDLIDSLAAIHSIDPASVGLARSEVDHADSARREIDRWETTMRTETRSVHPVMRAAMARLKANLPPPPDDMTVVHGDYRTGNLLYDDVGRITGILDWEFVHVGDPLEDLGWMSMRRWRWAADDRVCGVIDERSFIESYQRVTGRQVDARSLQFWRLFGELKLSLTQATSVRACAAGETVNGVAIARSGRYLDNQLLHVLKLLAGAPPEDGLHSHEDAGGLERAAGAVAGGGYRLEAPEILGAVRALLDGLGERLGGRQGSDFLRHELKTAAGLLGSVVAEWDDAVRRLTGENEDLVRLLEGFGLADSVIGGDQTNKPLSYLQGFNGKLLAVLGDVLESTESSSGQTDQALDQFRRDAYALLWRSLDSRADEVGYSSGGGGSA